VSLIFVALLPDENILTTKFSQITVYFFIALGLTSQQLSLYKSVNESSLAPRPPPSFATHSKGEHGERGQNMPSHSVVHYIHNKKQIWVCSVKMCWLMPMSQSFL